MQNKKAGAEASLGSRPVLCHEPEIPGSPKASFSAIRPFNQREEFMDRRKFSALVAATMAVPLLGCERRSSTKNSFTQTNLVADVTSFSIFNPSLRSVSDLGRFVNAWGIAIRPAGAGGHFWVTAGKYSFQFVGDVSTSGDARLRNLGQDGLKLVELPGIGDDGFATGTVFNGAPSDSNTFWVADQPVLVDGRKRTLSGSARFLFASDSGLVFGWTERDPSSPKTPVRVDGRAVAKIDDRANGAAFFGMAIRPDTWSTLWLADFGKQPRLRQFNEQWQEVALTGFKNPFATGNSGEAVPGDYVPFNIQVLRVNGADRVFVTYAKSQADPDHPGQFLSAEEDALDAALEGQEPDHGKVVMYSLDGALLAQYDDKRLNAPWGLAVAPVDFGSLSGCLLVGNFGGSGRIAAYNLQTTQFVDWLKDTHLQPVAIEGLWALQFGNGTSLGDSNALYFAAGPGDEKKGLFGSLRPSR
jgi:uncharacterized protein (TIGR03118 family)